MGLHTLEKVQNLVQRYCAKYRLYHWTDGTVSVNKSLKNVQKLAKFKCRDPGIRLNTNENRIRNPEKFRLFDNLFVISNKLPILLQIHGYMDMYDNAHDVKAYLLLYPFPDVPSI